MKLWASKTKRPSVYGPCWKLRPVTHDKQMWNTEKALKLSLAQSTAEKTACKLSVSGEHVKKYVVLLF